jgi:predicted TIM-barrel enzyme
MSDAKLLVTKLNEIFPGRRHVLLPVIHVEDEGQAVREARIAREAGCDGVFLINHAVSSEELLSIHETVAREFSDWWVGVNCLDLSPVEVFDAISDKVDGVWVDNAHIDERTEQQPFAECIFAARQRSGWQGLYFGGVAFKYQREVENLAAATKLAARYMDVVTTSGPSTGESASVEKIARMKSALGSFPLAIASGITPENVSDYLPFADCFLVATGISKSWNEFDPVRVKALAAAVRSFP